MQRCPVARADLHYVLGAVLTEVERVREHVLDQEARRDRDNLGQLVLQIALQLTLNSRE